MQLYEALSGNATTTYTGAYLCSCYISILPRLYGVSDFVQSSSVINTRYLQHTEKS